MFFFFNLFVWIIVASEISLSLQSPSTSSIQKQYRSLSSGCGSRPARRQPRSQNHNDPFIGDRVPKIIAGSPTKEGQFPWQASLELLHPSLGFLGHWCGGVLIHQYWILSAAHCVHNDLFNLPLPPLWTVVLGEHNRMIESGYEQRIPVEKIILHKSYHNFLHDLVLIKLSVAADLTKKSNIRRICLPFIYDKNFQFDSIPFEEEHQPLQDWNSSFDKTENFLRSVQKRNRNVTFPSMKELLSTKILNRIKNNKTKIRRGRINSNNEVARRNDKLMKVHMNDYDDALGDIDNLEKHSTIENENYQDYKEELPFVDCIATGWGKANITGDLTDILLQTNVPLHNNGRCREAYGSFVKIHNGHLCAGKLNGKGATCVGDSGGPLQCRLTKNGPWILAGITSFGSGCALEGFPDVYTRTSHYMKWIEDTIKLE